MDASADRASMGGKRVLGTTAHTTQFEDLKPDPELQSEKAKKNATLKDQEKRIEHLRQRLEENREITQKEREQVEAKREVGVSLENQNFENLDQNSNSKTGEAFRLETKDANVEIAKELGFAKIDPQIRELATKIFPENAFDLKDLANPETPFKLALLDSLERQFPKANMKGVRTFRDLSLHDQRQLVWNLQKVVPLLNPSLDAGKTFTRNDLDMAIATELAVEKALLEKERSNAQFRPLRLVDVDGVLVDQKVWVSFLEHLKTD